MSKSVPGDHFFCRIEGRYRLAVFVRRVDTPSKDKVYLLAVPADEEAEELRSFECRSAQHEEKLRCRFLCVPRMQGWGVRSEPTEGKAYDM